MRHHSIPTADFAVFSEAEAAKECVTFVAQKQKTCHRYIMAAPQKRLVVKASGLCAGKGVVVARDAHEACTFVDRCFEVFIALKEQHVKTCLRGHSVLLAPKSLLKSC